MRMGAWYFFRPIGPSLFRWKGEFSPQYRGPRALGFSEPFPLPSTFVGALAALAGGAGRPGNPLEVLGGDFGMWGPVLYMRGGRRRAAVHVYPGGLLVVDLEGRRTLGLVDALREGLVMERVGVELDVVKKAAAEGMLYGAAMFDARPLARAQGSAEVGYAVRVEGSALPPPGSIVRFGGEGRLAAVEVLGREDAEALEQLVPGAAGGIFMLASPAPMGPEMYADIISGRAADPVPDECPGLRGRLRRLAYLGSIGIGYDMARNARRPIYPALMPGSCVRAGPAPRLALVRDPLVSCCWGSLVSVPGG